MAKFLRRILTILLVIVMLCGAWFAKGFTYAEGGEVVAVSDNYLGSGGKISVGYEGQLRSGVWWYAPGFQTVTSNRLPGMQWPNWFQLTRAYKYWTLKEAEAMKNFKSLADNEDLNRVVEEILIVYVNHCEAYRICDWEPGTPPAIVTFFQYDRAEGWRLAGQFNFADDELTINQMFKADRPWGGSTVRDIIAHELWHSRGMYIIKRIRNEQDITWGDYWELMFRFDETFTQLGSADVLAHAIKEIGPEYEAALYGFLRSCVSSMMIYYGWYDGDSVQHLPFSIADVQSKMKRLRAQADKRESGNEICPCWQNPYYKDLKTTNNIHKLVYGINQKLAQLRQKAMQAECWELREWAYEVLQPKESQASKDIRFKKWLKIPEGHAEALLEYGVMPFQMLLNSKSTVVQSNMKLLTPFGMMGFTVGFDLNGLVPVFWEGLANSNWADVGTPIEYTDWLLKGNGHVGIEKIYALLALVGIYMAGAGVLVLKWWNKKRKQPRGILVQYRYRNDTQKYHTDPCKTYQWVTHFIFGDVWYFMGDIFGDDIE